MRQSIVCDFHALLWRASDRRARRENRKLARRCAVALSHWEHELASKDEAACLFEHAERVLDPLEYVIVRLKHHDRYSQTQIAARLGMHKGTVSRRLAAAYARLKESLSW